MVKHKPQTVARWLAGLPDVHNVRPCVVTIGKVSYVGAYAERTDRWQPGMDGVVRGEHKAGETYITRYFYLLGHLPKDYVRPGRVCYVIDGEAHEWYIGCHSDPKNPKTHKPYGPMFMLFPWNVPGKIDQYEAKPYRRVKVAVEWKDTE